MAPRVAYNVLYAVGTMKQLAIVASALLASSLVATAPGCVDSSSEDGLEDGINDEFANGEGKADGYGLTDAEAQAVMMLADTAPPNVAGVSTRVAKNIKAYVAGKDGRMGTADDQRFDSLEELDAIPYVGPTVLAALASEAASTIRASNKTWLSRHDVSVLFPLTSPDKLWRASDAARGGALLPKDTFGAIGMSLINTLDDAAEYDALRVVAVRFDPCFTTSLTSACQPQIRIVFQATSETSGTHDGAIHALYNLSEGEFAEVVAELRRIAPVENRAYGPLGVSRALKSQGIDGTYGTALRALVLKYAGASSLARMTFMTRTAARQGSWTFGGFHVKANPTTGFPAAGPIKIIGDHTTQTVGNGAFGSFRWSLNPGFLEKVGENGLDANAIPALSAIKQKNLYAWTQRQLRPELSVPDTTDCASCHLAGHIAQTLEAKNPAFPALDRGPRENPPQSVAGDNLRSFGYFFNTPFVSVRTANETAAVLRLIN